MNLFDPSYFGKIINILQILQGVCKPLTSTVCVCVCVCVRESVCVYIYIYIYIYIYR